MNDKPNSTVLISAPYIIPILDQIRSIFERNNLDLIVPEVKERLEEEQLLSYAGRFDGTICGDDMYTEKVLKACAPRLKVISKWGTGIDSIDREAAELMGIQVCRTPDAFSKPVADSVIGYILSFARRLPWMDNAMKSGEWKKIPGRSLSECTLGVIGVGNCGKDVIRRAHAFEMELLGNDIVEISPDFVMKYEVEMTSLEDLLRRSDFVSLNCDLNPTSFHLINKKTLAIMQPHAVLINLARGSVVNEIELIEALQSGRIAGAAMDVFEDEPVLPNSPFLEMDNVLLAPHNANSSPTAWEKVHTNTIRNLLVGLNIPDVDLSLS